VLCTGDPGRLTPADGARANAFTVLAKPPAVTEFAETLSRAARGERHERRERRASTDRCREIALAGRALPRALEAGDDDASSPELPRRMWQLQSAVERFVAERLAADASLNQVLTDVYSIVRESGSYAGAGDWCDGRSVRT
jgi:hypothetical protein